MTAFAGSVRFMVHSALSMARRIAEAAHVVVTNHSLMFCDLAADGGLLPRFDTGSSMRPMVRRTKRAERFRLIYLPTISRVSCAAFRRALGRVACSTGPSETSSFRMSKGTLFYALLNKARAAVRSFQAASPFSEKLRGLLYFEPAKKGA